MKDKVLLVTYHSQGPVREVELFEWVEHSNASVFRREVIRPIHRIKLIEYDKVAKTIEISPVGIEYVERNLV